MKILIVQLTRYRTNRYFDKMSQKAAKVAYKVNAEANFPTINTLQDN